MAAHRAESTVGDMTSFLIPRRGYGIKRYLYARILVLRAIVADFYLKQAGLKNLQPLRIDVSASEKLPKECFILCFEAAHETTNIFQQNLDFDTVTGEFLHGGLAYCARRPSQDMRSSVAQII